MAIAYDNSSKAFAGNGSGYTNWTHTCTGTNLILLVGIMEGHNTLGVTGITYNGVALTKISNFSQGSSDTVSLWYLINPTTGTNTIAVTGTNTSSSIYNSAISYTGVKQSGQPDSFNSGSTTGTPLVISTTTIANNTWVVGMWGASDGGSGGITAGTNVVSRQFYAGPGSSNFSSMMGDSNSVVTPAGSFSQTVSDSSGGLNNILGVIASISPANSQYTITAAVGTFSLTGYTISLVLGFLAAVGTFILTGFTATLKWRPYRWTNQSRNSTIWTNQGKS